jgi:pimeloyl-ACP methyl ester carboxylesterase
VASTAIAGGVPAYDPIKVDKLVLVAAPNSMPQAFRQFGRVIGLNAAAQEAMERHVVHVAGRPLESFVGADYLVQTKTPTLVIHARDDKEVPFVNAQALAAAGDFVTLKEVRGLGHRRILYAPQATETAARFIAKPAPAAADDASTRRLLLGAA